jgi:hypothetical protein
MAALATLTLVWLGAQKPNAAASAALQRFARERGVQMGEPHRDTAPERTASVSIAERCEGWLEQARDQLQAGDEEAARALLAQLEQGLRQHPELLQASWLMAEGYRLQARIARRSAPDQALRLEQLAEVTEEPRAPAFGEPSGSARTVSAKVRVTLVIRGARRPDIYWDGAPSGRDFSTAAGEHHLLVFRGARIGWAGWVTAVAPGPIDVWVPDAPPCSTEDFEGVSLDRTARVSVPSGVKCASWAAAGPGPPPFAVSIALCQFDRCQPSATLSDALAEATASNEGAGARSFLPSWAVWTLAGAGVVAATSIGLWQAGVFDTTRQPKVFYDGSGL